MRKTKIKVAFFAEILIHDFDGASRTMYQILDRIPSEEFEFMFFCGVPPDKQLNSEVVKLPTLKLPFNGDYCMVSPFFSKQKIHDKLDEFKPDVIHFASPSPMGNMAKKYGLKNKIPVATIYHTHFITYMKYFLRSVPFLTPYVYKKSVQLTRNMYKDPDIVYVPTRQMIAELQNICGLDGANLKLWQRGIDTELFNPRKRNLAFIRQLTGNDLPNILYASRLVWEKNVDTLIKFYQHWEEQNIAANFIIIGDGVARSKAEKLMPKAHFLGTLKHEHLSTYYASCDVFFFPSDTETFGNVVIEAMASGIPCVLANAGGPRSFVENDHSGFLCPTNDIAAYFDKVKCLLEEKETRERIINGGLELIDTFSWENLVSTYFNDLRKLAGVPIPKLKSNKRNLDEPLSKTSVTA